MTFCIDSNQVFKNILTTLVFIYNTDFHDLNENYHLLWEGLAIP